MKTAWTFDWTDAAIARLTDLWLAGHSSGECARHFGITRSAAIGKIGRLGLLRRDRPRPTSPLPAQLLKTPEQVSKPKPKRPAKTPDRYFAEFAAKPAPPPPEPPIGSFDLLELRNGHCRWPSDGDGPRWTFCGAPQAFGSSYCSDHHARSMSGLARGTPYVGQRMARS